ncbi:hypothetical protein [Pollutimonas subterranea]|uniref:hypothetical protein n=1 Tax=Pollutimonas subterranea TaxID=2045210 RepID=UPI001303FA1F|nr:hypothetical protein [Pollutimonas subterranea]
MSAEMVQLLVMAAIFLIITAVGSVALYRAGRPGWWLPVVFLALILGWPLLQQKLF